MTSSISLGRIFGIEIGINWSWLVVVALLVWTLASGIFPETNPGLSDGTYLAIALVAAALFFTSLLLHELGHALQARREGMEIDGITLWLFGGVARFKGMFPSAGAEFRIAIAGPLVSLALGILFALTAWALSSPEPVDAVAAWLAYINVTLLVFNLLPALPLDGGRVLRAALWQRERSFGMATRHAARVGRGFAYAFIAGGIALFVFQGSFSGAWLAFIGWFLLQAATAEDRYALVSESLRGLRVRDLMIREPVTVPAGMTIGQFMDEVAWSRRYTTYPVTEDGRVVGLLAFRCVAEVPRSEWDTRRVRDCMIPRERVPAFDEHDAAVDALAELSATDVNRGLVVDDGRLAGFISITDLARALEVAQPRERRAAAFLVLLALLAGGCSLDDGDEPDAAARETTTEADERQEAPSDVDFGEIPAMIERVAPSVVTVLVEGGQGEGSGSGVIWDEQGRIVTNNHVIEEAEEVEVALASGARLGARVVGADPRTDLAVLDVDRDGLPTGEFADGLPRVGELAIALGSPLGLENSASAGIVSALHRDLPSGGTTPALVDLIQTDAAISPGNSGGALVNAEGVVVGINVAYIPPEARAVSIGFAIPAPLVRDVVPQLIEDGEAEHAYLGVVPAPVTEELSEAFGLGVEEGALVRSVSEGSPAARAGLQEGDVIVEFDGEQIRTVEDLFAAIRERDPGQSVELTIVRDGERRNVDATLGRLPSPNE